MTMRGRGLRRLLKEQFQRDPDAQPHASGVSYDRRGEEIGAITVAGRPLHPNRPYTIAANALLVERGGFAAFRAARGVRRVGSDLEALVGLREARTR